MPVNKPTDTELIERARRKFEEWALCQPGADKVPFLLKRDNDRYHMFAMQCAWEAWQAALSASQREIRELKDWKELAIKVMLDYQAIGKLLDMRLGDSVSDNLIPAIKKLKAALSASEERIRELERRLNPPTNQYGENWEIFHRERDRLPDYERENFTADVIAQIDDTHLRAVIARNVGIYAEQYPVDASGQVSPTSGSVENRAEGYNRRQERGIGPADLRVWVIGKLRERYEKIAAARTAWLESFGVPISPEFAKFAEAIGQVKALADELERDWPEGGK